MDDSIPHTRFLLAGRLTRSFILLPGGEAVENLPGGSALHAAAGLAVWESGIGLIGRVGSDYSEEWLRLLDRWHLDRRGIRRLSDPLDVRSFHAYPDLETHLVDNPVNHYTRLGLPYPRELLGYVPPSAQADSRTQPTPFTIRQSDFPTDYLDATAAHICPLDFLSHTLLPPTFRQGNIHTITLDPAEGYMTPAFWDDMPVILSGLTAFLPSEEKLTALFQGRTIDPWEMLEALADWGCEISVMKRGSRGQYLYERASRRRWVIPAYPARVRDLTGAGDAFCGGFLAGFAATYDPLESVLQGNISASLVVENPSPFYAMDVMPGLARARLDSLRGMARRV